MNEKSVRAQIEQIKKELDRNDAERRALMAVYQGLQSLLALRTGVTSDGQASLPLAELSLTERDIPSARGAVLKVVRDASGRPMHVKEILARIEVMGARVKQDNPEGMVDLMLNSLRRSSHPVEKVAPRTWRWAEAEKEASEEKPNEDVL